MASEDHFEAKSIAIRNMRPYFRATKRSRQRGNIMDFEIVEGFGGILKEHAI